MAIKLLCTCTAEMLFVIYANGVLRKFHYTYHMVRLILLFCKHIIIFVSGTGVLQVGKVYDSIRVDNFIAPNYSVISILNYAKRSL